MDITGIDPKIIALFDTKTIEKFVSKLIIGDIPKHLDTPCLNYTGVLDKDGYGRVHVYVDGKLLRVPASRWALEVALREKLPKTTLACHHCDNPSCVEPLHLYPGTAKDNSDDKIKRGRNKKV